VQHGSVRQSGESGGPSGPRAGFCRLGCLIGHRSPTHAASAKRVVDAALPFESRPDRSQTLFTAQRRRRSKEEKLKDSASGQIKRQAVAASGSIRFGKLFALGDIDGAPHNKEIIVVKVIPPPY